MGPPLHKHFFDERFDGQNSVENGGLLPLRDGLRLAGLSVATLKG
jgi:hypothetical protein